MRWILTSDWHVPYYDPRAFTAFLAVVRDYRPTHIALLGDLIDFYMLSSYSKNPQRLSMLQADLDMTVQLLQQLRDTAPQATFYALLGNHELRLQRFLWQTDRAVLAPVRALQFRALFALDSMRIQLIESALFYPTPSVILTHGRVSRRRAGYSAHAELDRYLVSGASGHTHRLARIARRMQAQTLYWVEIGCLCQLGMEYDPCPDWQHGYGLLETTRHGAVGLLDARPLHPTRADRDLPRPVPALIPPVRLRPLAIPNSEAHDERTAI